MNAINCLIYQKHFTLYESKLVSQHEMSGNTLILVQPPAITLVPDTFATTTKTELLFLRVVLAKIYCFISRSYYTMMQVHTTEIFKSFSSLANSLELFLPKEEHFIHNTNSYCAKFARESFEILQVSKLQEAGVVQSV